MSEETEPFLPGVPVALVTQQLMAARGNELASGKFSSPRSSAALAVNAFGWFIGRPEMLPPLPGLADIDWPARAIAIERVMRFPWSRGTHPHLDAGIETDCWLIGVESKRFEPFLDTKKVEFKPAYERDWGDAMAPFAALRDDLRSGRQRFDWLDAAQLVKHAFGLATEAGRVGKSPVLYYIHAEPTAYLGRAISPLAVTDHRGEIARFAALVANSRVRFAAASYLEWLAMFEAPPARDHAARLIARFQP